MGISGIKQMFHTCKLWLHSNYLIGLIKLLTKMRNGLLSNQETEMLEIKLNGNLSCSQTLPSDQCISVLVEDEVAVVEIWSIWFVYMSVHVFFFVCIYLSCWNKCLSTIKISFKMVQGLALTCIQLMYMYSCTV